MSGREGDSEKRKEEVRKGRKKIGERQQGRKGRREGEKKERERRNVHPNFCGPDIMLSASYMAHSNVAS